MRSTDDLLGPPRAFTLSADEQARAVVGGAPAHLRRKRLIDDLVDAALAALRALRVAGAGPDALLAHAAALDLTRLDALVDAHNRWYPVEANLPLDLRSGAPLDRGRPWAPLPRFTAEVLVALASSD